jgi:hypothetical protein
MNSFLEFFVNSLPGGFILALLGFSMIIGIRKNSDLEDPSVNEDLIGYVGGFGFLLIGLAVLIIKTYQHLYK